MALEIIVQECCPMCFMKIIKIISCVDIAVIQRLEGGTQREGPK